MLDEREVAARRQALANALANQRLEGLEPDQQVLVEMERVVVGELDISDVIRDFIGRVTRGEVRG